MKWLKLFLQFIPAISLQHLLLVIVFHIISKLFYTHGFNIDNISELGTTLLYVLLLYHAVPILNLISLIFFYIFSVKNENSAIENSIHSIAVTFLIGILVWLLLSVYFEIIGENHIDINEILQYERELLNPVGYFMQCFLISNILFYAIYAFIWNQYIREWIRFS